MARVARYSLPGSFAHRLLQAIDNGLKAVKFDRTPIMSTYLLAFVVGEFDVIQVRRLSPTP